MFRKQWREELRRMDIASAQRARQLGVRSPARDAKDAQERLRRVKEALRQMPDKFARR